MLQMEVTFDMNAPIFGSVSVYVSCGEAAEKLRSGWSGRGGKDSMLCLFGQLDGEAVVGQADIPGQPR